MGLWPWGSDWLLGKQFETKSKLVSRLSCLAKLCSHKFNLTAMPTETRGFPRARVENRVHFPWCGQWIVHRNVKAFDLGPKWTGIPLYSEFVGKSLCKGFVRVLASHWDWVKVLPLLFYRVTYYAEFLPKRARGVCITFLEVSTSIHVYTSIYPMMSLLHTCTSSESVVVFLLGRMYNYCTYYMYVKVTLQYWVDLHNYFIHH